MENQRCCIAIDLKSFYASAECMSRGLDPMTTNLVVADASRTEKTICLAVSPSLKRYGIPGRARLFEVIQKVKEENALRLAKAHRKNFTGKSCDAAELAADSSLALDFITAPPRMAHYIELSSRIYDIYLKYVAPEDIHVYSIDEVFIEASDYLRLYGLSGRELAIRMMTDVLESTGITATAGIGTNLYLSKIAMDIYAKHVPADENGMRIAELDEMTYRKLLWEHTPLTDFWRVGKGIANRLAQYNILTMGDVARCSIEHEGFLYQMFGVNAELLIDHAWGWEPVTMEYVKAYKPESKSLSSGQVLQSAYTTDMARNVILEMADSVSLDLVDKRLLTDQLVLTVGYDIESLTNPSIREKYHGKITTDHYGRQVPVNAHGTINIEEPTSAGSIISEKVAELYGRIVNPVLLVRRLNLSVNHLVHEEQYKKQPKIVQLDLFTDFEESERQRKADLEKAEKERRRQEAILSIKKKFGKNAILKGINYADGATQKERNQQIGGHHE